MGDDHSSRAEHDDGDELAELRALAGRVPLSDPDWEPPPAGLWERIAAETGVSGGPVSPAAVRTVDVGPPSDDVGPVENVAPVGGPRQDDPPAHRPGGSATATDLSSRRRLPWVIGAVAAAVVLIVGVAALVRQPSAEPTVVASTPLGSLGPAGSGEVELVDADGELRLRLDISDVDPGDGFLEVWMIDTDVTRLVSLGPVRADGTYDLPPGLDPAQFPVVDVSVEPLDGDPTHSGDSVLRGELAL